MCVFARIIINNNWYVLAQFSLLLRIDNSIFIIIYFLSIFSFVLAIRTVHLCLVSCHAFQYTLFSVYSLLHVQTVCMKRPRGPSPNTYTHTYTSTYSYTFTDVHSSRVLYMKCHQPCSRSMSVKLRTAEVSVLLHFLEVFAIMYTLYALVCFVFFRKRCTVSAMNESLYTHSFVRFNRCCCRTRRAFSTSYSIASQSQIVYTYIYAAVKTNPKLHDRIFESQL